MKDFQRQRHYQRKMKKFKFLIPVLLAVILFVIGYFVFVERGESSSRGNLSEIRKKGRLVVLTRNAPTTYYEGPDGFMGFEHDLVMAFAEHLGVKVKFKIKETISEILDAIEQGKGDIAASGLTRTEEREKRFLFGPDYHKVQQQVVCRRGSNIPRGLRDLTKTPILIIAESSYEQRLKELKSRIPSLKWKTTEDLATEQILEKVWKKELECTVADSNIAAINQRYYPELVIAFPITKKQPLAWILGKEGKELEAELRKWLKKFRKSGRLAALSDKYYAHVEIFDYVDVRTFHRRILERLPRLETWFKKAGEKYDIPWTLLAAMAYQESHWDARATSPTGVRGVMMLTQKTAKAMGVKKRRDPYQSIMGGARYLAKLRKFVPESVREEDRLAYTLATYNVGRGHMKDALKLAKRLGKNPYSWRDLKTVLPLLSQKKYYRKLKHGYARGSEPVQYVERIYNYRDILERSLGIIS